MSWTKLLFLFFVLRSASFPRKFPISYLRFVNFNSNAPETVPSSVCAYYLCSRAFWGGNRKKKDIKQEEGQRDMFHVLLSTTLLNQNETNLWFESFRALERSSNWPQYALHEAVGRATEPPEGDWSKYALQSEQQLMSSNRLEWENPNNGWDDFKCYRDSASASVIVAFSSISEYKLSRSHRASA